MLLKNVKFDNYNSINDFEMFVEKSVIGNPKPRTRYVDIPFGNGSLDMTEALGVGVTYSDRSLKFQFVCKPNIDWSDKATLLNNRLHGKRMQIMLSDDANHYFDGRVSVDSVDNKNGRTTVTISANCKPYRLRTSETTKTVSVTTTQTSVTLTNGCMPVLPEITTNREIQVEFNGNTDTIAAGTHKLLNLRLVEGNNVVKVKTTSGSGSVTFKYREGDL